MAWANSRGSSSGAATVMRRHLSAQGKMPAAKKSVTGMRKSGTSDKRIGGVGSSFPRVG